MHRGLNFLLPIIALAISGCAMAGSITLSGSIAETNEDQTAPKAKPSEDVEAVGERVVPATATTDFLAEAATADAQPPIIFADANPRDVVTDVDAVRVMQLPLSENPQYEDIGVLYTPPAEPLPEVLPSCNFDPCYEPLPEPVWPLEAEEPTVIAPIPETKTVMKEVPARRNMPDPASVIPHSTPMPRENPKHSSNWLKGGGWIKILWD